MNFWTTISVFLLLTCQVCTASTSPNETAFPIAVEAVGIERSGGHIYLDMRVWNCSDKALTMDIANLPWGGSLVRGLVVFTAGEPLEQSVPIEDFPITPYVIPALGSITGRVALDRYFPDLANIRNVGDAVVFWVYQPLGDKGAPVGKKFGGMVPLDSGPIETSGQNRCRSHP